MVSNGTIRVFSGATAIVTGGASGIGRALAEELAKRGCEVVLADRQVEVAEEVASGIRSLTGGKATAVKLDVTDFPAVQQLARDTVERTGRLDYMFNNAGIAIVGNVHHYGIQEWNQIMDVNLHGVVNGVQAAYGFMMNQGFGHIVNTASDSGPHAFSWSRGLFDDQACGGRSFKVTTSRSLTLRDTRQCLMSWSDPYVYSGRGRQVWQNAHRYPPGKAASDVGEAPAHVTLCFRGKGNRFSGKEQTHHYRAVLVEGILVDQSLFPLAGDSACSKTLSENNRGA